jgi:hypothetical protein
LDPEIGPPRLEVLLIIANVGTAVALFPILK